MRKQHIKSHPVASLYVENQSWLRGWLYRKVGCTHLAADLVQDTFERLLKRESYGDVEKSGAYLKTTARNLVIDHWRRKALEAAYMEALHIQGEAYHPSPEEQHMHLDLLNRIDQAVQRLPVQTRQVFLRVQLEGWGYAKVAESLGISVSTVKRHLKTALLECCFYCE